jgi:ankyrin repeat protein
MKKTTKRRQNGGGAGASVPESIGSRLCKQAIKGMRTGMNQSTIIELLNNIEDLDKGYITNNNCIDNKTGASLLIIASIKGYIDVVKYLITKGVDINYISKIGNTALHVAALNGNIDVVKELLNNPNCNNIMFNKKGYTPLQLAIASSANLDSITEIIEEFKLRSININAHTTFGYGPLHIVALNNKHEIIPFLADNGAIVDSKTDDDNQYTPLHIACINGYEEVAKALLSIDANPDILSKQQWSSIYYAAQKGYTNIVRDLLTNGANPDISPLSPPGAGGVAFFNGHFELADMIWKETSKSLADIEKEKNGSKTQKISKYKILENSVDNYDPDGSNDYDHDDEYYPINFEAAADSGAKDSKPGGSKRAYPPRKTRRQSKRRRRQNKK